MRIIEERNSPRLLWHRSIRFNYALNEVSVGRENTTSMIEIKTTLDGEYLNTYWADGLIISTPTGSTGYSLSCGGPIMTPSSQTFSITPIAPHNLNARPLIISDETNIELSVKGSRRQRRRERGRRGSWRLGRRRRCGAQRRVRRKRRRR